MIFGPPVHLNRLFCAICAQGGRWSARAIGWRVGDALATFVASKNIMVPCPNHHRQARYGAFKVLEKRPTRINTNATGGGSATGLGHRISPEEAAPLAEALKLAARLASHERSGRRVAAAGISPRQRQFDMRGRRKREALSPSVRGPRVEAVKWSGRPVCDSERPGIVCRDGQPFVVAKRRCSAMGRAPTTPRINAAGATHKTSSPSFPTFTATALICSCINRAWTRRRRAARRSFR
jgi:hypothetical protein